MASPFPGMDPYLEAPDLWPTFQHGLVACLLDVLQPNLSDRYRLRCATRAYVNEQALFVTVVREEHREDFLEIRQRSTGRIVTLVDLVSPTNRTTGIGRQKYLEKRDEVRRAGVNLVELELVLQGQTCLNLGTGQLPQWDYVVSVSRAHQPDRYEIYTTTLQNRLPRFRLPLVSDERDVVVDLQSVFTRCYDVHFGEKLDYKKEPPTLLKDTDHRWVQQMLKGQGLR